MYLLLASALLNQTVDSMHIMWSRQFLRPGVLAIVNAWRDILRLNMLNAISDVILVVKLAQVQPLITAYHVTMAQL